MEGTPELEGDGQKRAVYRELIQRWRDGDYAASVPQGESAAEVAARLQQILPQLLSHKEDIMVCTHGRTMRILLCLLTHIPLSQQDSFEHSNTSVNGVQDGVVTIFNNMDHL